MAATAVTEVGRIDDGVKGGRVKFYTFLLDPASINAAAQGTETVAVPGAKVGDLVFVNPEALETKLNVSGAKVTGNDEVTIYLNNTYDASTAVNGGEKKYNLMHVKLV